MKCFRATLLDCLLIDAATHSDNKCWVEGLLPQALVVVAGAGGTAPVLLRLAVPCARQQEAHASTSSQPWEGLQSTSAGCYRSENGGRHLRWVVSGRNVEKAAWRLRTGESVGVGGGRPGEAERRAAGTKWERGSFLGGSRGKARLAAARSEWGSRGGCGGEVIWPNPRRPFKCMWRVLKFTLRGNHSRILSKGMVRSSSYL